MRFIQVEPENGEFLTSDVVVSFINTAKFGLDLNQVCCGSDPRWRLVEIGITVGMIQFTVVDVRNVGIRKTVGTCFHPGKFTVWVANESGKVRTYFVRIFGNGPTDEDGDELVATILELSGDKPETFERIARRNGGFIEKKTRLNWDEFEDMLA